jgi:L-fucose isomerase-like protein
MYNYRHSSNKKHTKEKKMHKKSIVNQKLVVQPLYISLCHKEAFMGPCRYGSGVELTYEYDMKVSMEILEVFKQDIKNNIDTTYVETLEPITLNWHENFAITDEEYNKATANDSKVYVYLISGTRLFSYVSTIIAKRTNKPLAFCPLSNSNYSRLGGIDATAHMKAFGYEEMYNALTYDDLNRYFRVMKVRKALKNTRTLYGLRNNVISFGAVSAFVDLNDFYTKLGMEVINYNTMEFFNVMDNLTEEECEEAEKITDHLVNTAEAVHMPAENIVNDVKFYMAVNKVMEEYDCNSFTCPCFEMCATKELNKRNLTFCLTHSLLKDEGVPSACASDVNSIVCYQIMMNLARKAPHMGNCMVRVNDMKNNTMRILHDVPCRYMKGYDNKPLDVSYVSFAKENWGATMRYDFAKDAGDTITMINISPRLDKIMIATGEIVGSDDVLTQECKLAVVFKVNDVEDFHIKEQEVGHHFIWVYGDYKKDLLELARIMGMEAIIA